MPIALRRNFLAIAELWQVANSVPDFHKRNKPQTMGLDWKLEGLTNPVANEYDAPTLLWDTIFLGAENLFFHVVAEVSETLFYGLNRRPAAGRSHASNVLQHDPSRLQPINDPKILAVER